MARLRIGPVAALASWLAVSTGCGSGLNLAPVSGTVTYKGNPIAKATVVFHPTEKGARSAMGETDERGHYTLWTVSPGDGAVVGKYQVTITLRGAPEKAALHPSVKNKELGEAYYDQVASTGKPLIPEKYFTAEKSGLTATVVAGQSNTIDFSLEGDVPKK